MRHPSRPAPRQATGSSSARWRRRGLLVAAAVAASVAAPRAGMAQDLFGFFRFFRDRAPAPRYEPRAYADPSEVPPDIGRRGPAMESSGRSTYCVRLCDGRFFPLTGAAASASASAVKTCAALCPAGKTAVFRGGRIDDAVAPNGDRYADLANAFLYRHRLVDGCTCNGKDPFGLARLDVTTDPTLRAGDVVATTEGLKVFTGGKGTPHANADFTPVADAGKLPAELRRRLATTRVLTAP